MDPSSSHITECDEDTKALQTLLDVFGSLCSLEEIASAYSKSGRDVSKAGDILYQSQESNTNGVCHADNGVVVFAQPKEPLNEDHTNVKVLKPRKLSASMGTVSSLLGKTYTHHNSSIISESSETTKPLKLQVTKSLMDAIETEPDASDFMTREELLKNTDLEEFIFSMLGDGFKLSRDVIREVLGNCRYDVKKSMEELLALSAKTLEKGKATVCDMVEKVPAKCPDMEPCVSVENYFSPSQRNFVKSSTLEKERSNLPREILESLFIVPDKSDEEPKRKRPEWGLNRRRTFGQKVVTKPLDDNLTPIPSIPKMIPGIENDLDEEDEYHVLRRAVKVHWDTMKTYYEAAVEAFAKGDRVQANYLLEQGKYYNQMAREADEKSAGEIVDTRKSDIQADLTLNLHTHKAKDAIHLLKLHLRSLTSSSFKYLKVIVDSGAEDVTKGKRKRLVTKLLERESIQWTEEEGNPGTFFIQLDVIDPKQLSFAKDLE